MTDIQYSIATMYMLCTVSCFRHWTCGGVPSWDNPPPLPQTQTHVPHFAVRSLTMVREYYCPIKTKLSLGKTNYGWSVLTKKNHKLIMSYVHVCNLYMYPLHLEEWFILLTGKISLKKLINDLKSWYIVR